MRGVLAWSPDARHWHYIAPEKSFVPLGRPATTAATTAAAAAAATVSGSGNGGDGSSSSGSGSGSGGGGGGVESPDFDCCGVFMAKQVRATLSPHDCRGVPIEGKLSSNY